MKQVCLDWWIGLEHVLFHLIQMNCYISRGFHLINVSFTPQMYYKLSDDSTDQEL